MDKDYKVELIKKQIGSAIAKAEGSKHCEGVCAQHPDQVDFEILSIRVGEMVLDEVIDFKQEFDKLGLIGVKQKVDSLSGTVEAFVQEKLFVQRLWKLAAATLSTSGILGTVWLIMQISKTIGAK